MPASAANMEYAFPIVPIATNQAHVRLSDIFAQLKVRIYKESARSTSFSSGHGPLGYLPQAAGVALLQPLGRSPLAAMYLGRLLNLLCSVVLVYFAIRLLPFNKPVTLRAEWGRFRRWAVAQFFGEHRKRPLTDV